MPVAVERLLTVAADGYEWKQNTRIPVAAEVAVAEFRRIYATHHAVQPQTVVEESRPPDAPLHECFEWDDATAAAIHRDSQARYLLRSLVVVYRQQNGEHTPPIRAMVKLEDSNDAPALSEEEAGAVAPYVYIPLNVVMEAGALRERYVRQAFRDLVRWRDRYRDITEFTRIFDAIAAEEPQYHAG